MFRRAICAIPTNSLNKTFATFGEGAEEGPLPREHPGALPRFCPPIAGFPSDEEFRRDLHTRDLYNFRSRSYWLRRLENHGRKERVAVDEYTIEHILPQNQNLSAAVAAGPWSGVGARAADMAAHARQPDAHRLQRRVQRPPLRREARHDGRLQGKSAADRELAIQQIVSRAVVSTEIVDIMKAAGLASPDISILSDEFLAEVRDTDKKNLAIEALKKLINGDVRSQSKRNVTQSKAFSERLEAAISRYHANALTTAQVIEELIQLAKDIRAARARGEETGLTDEEIAFYDALAENESARQVMGEPALRVIATELVASIKSNVSVDWMHREAARARMRVLVKRLLRKYGYPPDLQDAAVQKVLQQAEALSADWAA